MNLGYCQKIRTNANPKRGHSIDRNWDRGVRFRKENLDPEINSHGHAFITATPMLPRGTRYRFTPGTERSIRLGAFMWRLVGTGVLINGLIRLR